MDKEKNHEDYTAKGRIFLGAVENGTIKLSGSGFEFVYSNPRIGKNVFYAWTDIVKVELDISLRGKVGTQFGLYLKNNSKVRFTSKDSGALLKRIGQHIGTDKMVRSHSLLAPLVDGLKF